MRLLPLAALVALSLAHPAAAAEKWLKIDPKDPFSKEGSFHMFDVVSAFEDEKTGLVAAHMTYAKPDDAAGGVAKWYVWAFDCKAKTVYYVANPADAGGATPTPDWKTKPNTLAKPVMDGVTNMFGKKLCALKGSWPKGTLP
jgi:hypothetical protein